MPFRKLQGFQDMGYLNILFPSVYYGLNMMYVILMALILVVVFITGKSLCVKRLHERLQEEQPDCTELLKTIRLIEPQVDEDKVLKSLLPFLKREHQTKPMIFHFDITSSVSTSLPQLPCRTSPVWILAGAFFKVLVSRLAIALSCVF